MEHPFFATNAPTRAEAQRWLTIAEKLLSTRDLMGSKSFASRAHDSDPTLTQANQILAVADTLLAGDIRIGNNNHDWYSILRLNPSQGRDSDLVATQYRNLALLLNPQTNNFAYADQAFRLVIEAWSVLSNPSRKNLYDSELAFLAQQEHDPFGNANGTMPLNFMLFGDSINNNTSNNNNNNVGSNLHVGSSSGGVQNQFVSQNYMNYGSSSNVGFGAGTSNLNAEAFFTGGANVSYADATGNQEQVNVNRNVQQERQDNNNGNNNRNVNDGNGRGDEGVGVREDEGLDGAENGNEVPTFWTACPYCYHMFEYPKVYVDCCLKCEICKRAFQGVVIPSPPPVKEGDKNYCCFGFMPLGFSNEDWEKNEGGVPAWSPFSPMFTASQPEKKRGRKRGFASNPGPRVYFDDDDDFVDLSDSGDDSDGDWRNNGKETKRKANGKGSSGTATKIRKKSQADYGKSVQKGVFRADNVEMLNKTTVESNEKGPTPNNESGEPSKKDLASNQTTTGEPSKIDLASNQTTTGGPSKKAGSGTFASTGVRKQPVRGAKSYGRLDLNMEFNNEAEEPTIRMNGGNGRREDENVEGIGFFEGLDEFLSNLPILNAVDDDKAIKA